jgi:dihydrofolate reductase
MIEVVYGVASSLDGFIATPDGGADWLQPFTSASFARIAEFLKTIDALFIGSRTYELMAPHGGAAVFGKPCYVFSSRRLSAESGVTVTSDSPARVVAEAEKKGIRRVWHFGGAKLFESFRRAGLITEYSLAVVPVILGAGIPLFASPGPATNLQLVESAAEPNGTLALRYKVLAE